MYCKHSFITVLSITFVICLILIAVNISELNKLANLHCDKDSTNKELDSPRHVSDSLFSTEAPSRAPVVWISSKNRDNIYTRLNHVVNAFKIFYYQFVNFELTQNVSEDLWDVLWSQNYPFLSLKTYFQNLKNVHCINHVPGTSFISSKVHLAKSHLPYIPRAFHMPQEKEALLKFSKDHPDVMFVHKSNDHRGIKIEKIETLNFFAEDSFVQQFIHKPLLVDGYKFDIGLYTVVTSVNPLRVYISKDILLRFCPEKYYPFFANMSRKYVVDDDYRPIWKVSSLKHLYIDQGFGMKDSLDAWLKTQNQDPEMVWEKMKAAVSRVFMDNEQKIVKFVDEYPRNIKFFELFRFDFIVDEDMNVYLMEANMSPNLNSAHFKENRLLYEQVVFNTISLVGISYHSCSGRNASVESKEMKVAFKDIAVFPEHCTSQCRTQEMCVRVDCQMCKLCVTSDTEEIFKRAFLEHTWRGSYRRIIPQPIRLEEASHSIDSSNLSPENTLMAEWYRGKCLLDQSFCS